MTDVREPAYSQPGLAGNPARDIKNNIYIQLPVYTPLMILMRGPALLIVAAGLVVGLCFCAGCILGPSAPEQPVVNNTSVDVGIVPVAGSIPRESFTLEEAASVVTGKLQDQGNGSMQEHPFYYIKGENVDTSGKAERWIFGIMEDNHTSMMMYDQTGVVTIPLQGADLPTQEINISGILSPASIIKIAYPQNQNITGTFGIRISDGEYTLTTPLGSQPRGYMIDATTGVLMTTYD